MIRRSAKPSSNYLVVSNSVVCDRRISFAAGGLLLHLLSKPAHWEVSPSALAKEAQEGRDKIYKLLSELIDVGYCKRVTRRERGKIVGTDYEISDAPEDADPLPEKQIRFYRIRQNRIRQNRIRQNQIRKTRYGLPYRVFPTQESKDTKKVKNLESNQRESAQERRPAGSRKSGPQSKRGTRLPSDWEFTCEFHAEAQRVRPDLIHRIHEIADEFKDYWVALSGQRGVKTDWLATWRNWLRRERSGVPQVRAGPQDRTRDRSINEILTDTSW